MAPVFATWNTIQSGLRALGQCHPGLAGAGGRGTPETLHAALEQAGKHTGLALIHVPVYYGPDPLGGMGVYGRWNVGNWARMSRNCATKIGL